MGGREECGYIWNAKDTAPASKTVEGKSISLACHGCSGRTAGLARRLFHCEDGRLLRQEGEPYVVFHPTLSRLCSRFPQVNAPSSVRFYNQHIDQYQQNNHL
jgi:hypothetical protein